jgi:hypothetical protein
LYRRFLQTLQQQATKKTQYQIAGPMVNSSTPKLSSTTSVVVVPNETPVRVVGRGAVPLFVVVRRGAVPLFVVGVVTTGASGAGVMTTGAGGAGVAIGAAQKQRTRAHTASLAIALHLGGTAGVVHEPDGDSAQPAAVQAALLDSSTNEQKTLVPEHTACAEATKRRSSSTSMRRSIDRESNRKMQTLTTLSVSLLVLASSFFGVSSGTGSEDDVEWSTCLWCGEDEATRQDVGLSLFEYCWQYDDALLLLEEERCHDAWRRYLHGAAPLGPATPRTAASVAGFEALWFGTMELGRSRVPADVYDAHHATADEMRHILRLYELDRALGIDRHVAVVRRQMDACVLARLTQFGDSVPDVEGDTTVLFLAKATRLHAVCAAANGGDDKGIVKNAAPYDVLVIGSFPRAVYRPRPNVLLALAASVDAASAARAVDRLSVEELYRYLVFVYMTDTWGRLRDTLLFQTRGNDSNPLSAAFAHGGAAPIKNVTGVLLMATKERPSWEHVRELDNPLGLSCELSCAPGRPRRSRCSGLDELIDASETIDSASKALDRFGPLLPLLCDVPQQLEWRLESVDIASLLMSTDIWQTDAGASKVLVRRIETLRHVLRDCAERRATLGCTETDQQGEAHVRREKFAAAVEIELISHNHNDFRVLDVPPASSSYSSSSSSTVLGSDDFSNSRSESTMTASGGSSGGGDDDGSTAQEFLKAIKTNQFSRWAPAVVRLRLKGCAIRRSMTLARWSDGLDIGRPSFQRQISESDALSVFYDSHTLAHAKKLIFRAQAFGVPFVVKMVAPMVRNDLISAEQAQTLFESAQRNLRHEQRVLSLLDKHRSVARLYASCASNDVPELLDWTDANVGFAAMTLVNEVIFGAVGLDFIVVEELQELSELIDTGRLSSVQLVRDRVALCASLFELVLWLGEGAPGAPWHMCAFTAAQFGVGRNAETGMAEVRLLDADHLFSRQLVGLDEAPDLSGCLPSNDATLVGPALMSLFVAPIWRAVATAVPCELAPLFENATAWRDAAFFQRAASLLRDVKAHYRQANAYQTLCNMAAKLNPNR